MGDSAGRMNGSACKFRREPYRATKLWLEAVAIFRRGVPLGRHRRHLKMYDNCFPSQDAITWFQSQLQIAFDPSITRKQTLTLLQKFYKANIITEVNRGEQKGGRSPVVNETDFKDSGQLYRLVCPSPNGSTTPRRTSTKSVKVESPKKNAMMTKSMSQFDVIIKPLTAEEINEIWGQAFIDRFVKIIGCDVFTSFFQPGLIQGASISYNLTRVGPHNIVIATNKEQDLPHWLVSAMKCLSNWPNNHTQENGVPNYPGFESDVFKLICDYFAQYQKGNPLLTYNLYDAFITCFIRAELFDFNSRLYSAKITNAARSRVFQVQQQQLQDANMNNTTGKSPMFRMEDQYPFNASESVENLILDILTPSASKGLRKRFIQQHQNQMGLNPRKTLFPEASSSSSDYCTMSLPRPSANESIISNAPMPNPMAPKSYELARYTLPLYYETAFTGKESPITRVVSHTELKSSLGERKQQKSQSRVRLPAASADAILDGNSTYAYVNPTLELSASDMINHPKYSHILQACDLEGNTSASPGPFYWNETIAGGNTNGTLGRNSNGTLGGNTSGSSGGNTSMNGLTSHSLIDDKFMGTRPSRAVSAGNLMDAAGRAARPSHNFTLPTSNNSNGPRSPWTPGQSLAAHYSMSPSKSVRRMLEFYYGADACVPGLMTSEGKQLAILSFRLLTLLLPPVNRRHLQILVRFMSKTAHNEKLRLDVAASARAVVINTFFRMILRSEDPAEYDELLALRIVTFLMDNDQEIFAVGDENEIVKDAQLKISERQIIKVPTTMPAAQVAATNRMVRSVSSPTLLREDVVEGNPQSDQLVYSEANKENNVRFCSRITMNEYEDQRLLQGTAQSLRDLLDSWVSDEKLDAKEKKRQILKFKATYPHIFREKFGGNGEHPSFLNETVMPSKPKKEKKGWKVLRALRL